MEPVTSDLSGEAINGFLAAGQHPEGVLYILDGQYVFRYEDEQGARRSKFIAPEAVRLAFSRLPVDSGWLPPLV